MSMLSEIDVRPVDADGGLHASAISTLRVMKQ
jgi:hypothetical protein